MIASRWKTLVFVVLMQAYMSGTIIYCFGFFAVRWVADFDVPRSEFLAGFTGLMLLSGVASPIAGILIDRFAKRNLAILGILFFSGGMLLSATANSPLLIVALYFLVFPVSMALGGPLISQSLVAASFTEKRGMAMGICALGTSIGGFSMPLIVTTLLETTRWEMVSIGLGLGVLILVPMAYFFVPLIEQDEGSPHKKENLINTRAILKNPDVYKLAVAFFVPSTLFVGVLQNIGLHATDLSISQQQAGVIVSLTAILMAVGKFSIGSLSDRLNHRLIYLSVCTAVATGLIICATAKSFYPLAIGVCLLGTTAGGVLPLISSMVAQRFGARNFGRVMGIIMVSAALSGLTPLLAGLIRDATGSYENAFWLFIPALVPAAIAFALLSKHQKAGETA
jgi:MFS family permease